jgi:hypothetical protein
MAVHVDCKMAYETTLDGDGMVEMSCKLHWPMFAVPILVTNLDLQMPHGNIAFHYSA